MSPGDSHGDVSTALPSPGALHPDPRDILQPWPFAVLSPHQQVPEEDKHVPQRHSRSRNRAGGQGVAFIKSLLECGRLVAGPEDTAHPSLSGARVSSGRMQSYEDIK